MTEVEWLAATDPTPMLEFLTRKSSDRKLRLFAVACCRSSWSSFPKPVGESLVEAAERYADGDATEEELQIIRDDETLPWFFADEYDSIWSKAKHASDAASEAAVP